jgi:hypothetical protein
MINVIVVPENDDFKHDATQNLVVYINKALGIPKLKDHNAKYLAPFWLKEGYVDRLYHIVKVSENESDNAIVIYLGNSFILKEKWKKNRQTQRFEYHPLKSFNFVEITDGLLLSFNFNE